MVTPRVVSLRTDNPLESNLTELEAAESVDRGFLRHTDWLAHTVRYQLVADFMVSHKTRTLLDVGCGHLQLPYFLYRNRMPAIDAYWGLDLRIKQAWANEYRWNTPATLVQMDVALDNPLDVEGWPGQFDLAVCTEVAEHLPKSAVPQLLGNLFRWIKPGGHLLFSTPNRHPKDFSSVADNHIGPDGVPREWWWEDLSRVIADTGFHIVDMTGTFMKTRRIPTNTSLDTAVDVLRRRLPYAVFSVAAAALFPTESTNIFWTLAKETF